MSDLINRLAPEKVTEWGVWTWVESESILAHKENEYYVPLAECATSAKILDRIIQIGKKSWCSAEDLGNLVKALNYLIDFQTVCGSGQDQPISDPVQHIKNRMEFNESIRAR